VLSSKKELPMNEKRKRGGRGHKERREKVGKIGKEKGKTEKNRKGDWKLSFDDDGISLSSSVVHQTSFYWVLYRKLILLIPMVESDFPLSILSYFCTKKLKEVYWSTKVNAKTKALTWNCKVKSKAKVLTWNCKVKVKARYLTWNCKVKIIAKVLTWNWKGIEKSPMTTSARARFAMK